MITFVIALQTLKNGTFGGYITVIKSILQKESCNRPASGNKRGYIEQY